MGGNYYVGAEPHLDGIRSARSVGWREPQLGAIAAVISHWTTRLDAALVSMPTGSGKTAVELALPHLKMAARTLVLVPSALLRDQIAGGFERQDILRRMLVLDGEDNPVVHVLASESGDLEPIAQADVVVTIPSTLAAWIGGETPRLSRDFFDLVIVDEAHHAPAPTWEQVLRHFESAAAVLFTATPRRRDRKPVPGRTVYHYPVRRALQSRLFNPISPVVVPIATLEEKDASIVDAVRAQLEKDGYSDVPVLARVATIERSDLVADLYRQRGLVAEPYHSKLSALERTKRLARWKASEVRVLVGGDALGEGLDYPDLRVLGYHDKHKSEPATVQQIGRLARRSLRFAVPSVLVTAKDEDVYPALKGSLRRLYEEDSDWAEVLPGLIDDELEAIEEVNEYAASFGGMSSEIRLAAIHPLGSIELREPVRGSPYEPQFYLTGEIPAGLKVGETIFGKTVVLSQLSEDRRMLFVCSQAWESPSWYADENLATNVTELCVVSWHPDPAEGHVSVLAITSTDGRVQRAVLEALDPEDELTLPDSGALQAAGDSIDRVSVSNVGVRSTNSFGQGVAQYANYSGRGVDRGLGESEVARRALGHAMMQIRKDGKSVNAGFAVEKGKYWELRHMSLLEYWEFVTRFVSLYWKPEEVGSARLLPGLARGTRVVEYPGDEVVFAELDPRLIDQPWTTASGTSLATLVASADLNPEQARYLLVDEDTSEVVWEGTQAAGSTKIRVVQELWVHRGFETPVEVGYLIESWPMTLYLRGGQTVRGATIYERPRGHGLASLDMFVPWDWQGVDTLAEVQKPGRTDTIHDEVERRLLSRDRGRSDWWVFRNDGKGELADHIAISMAPDGSLLVELWHSKAAGGLPSVRVTDFEVLAQQAVKSRRLLVEEHAWEQLGRRLSGLESPELVYIGGSSREKFEAMCGLRDTEGVPNLAKHPRRVTGRIVLVQPGLSLSALRDQHQAEARTQGAQQLLDILAVARAANMEVAETQVICSE